MNDDIFEMMVQLDNIDRKLVKEAQKYAGQSGIELRFTPNPTQMDLDNCVAMAFIEGYLLAKQRVQGVL